MSLMKKLLFIVAAALLFAAAPASARITPVLSTTKLYQGDTLFITLPRSAVVASSTFDGRPINFFRYGGGQKAAVPIPATASVGAHRLYIKFNGGAYSRTLSVRARKFPVVSLGVPDKINETPAQVVGQFADINAELNSIVAVREAGAFFAKGFRLPLTRFVRYGSPFGEVRKTGASLVRHLGTDFTAPAGAPVLAINDGVVKLATSTDIYGNTVVIDHGAGIYSLYLHLSRMDVAPGAAVRSGQVIGAVGDTGYAFAPHLHLSVKVDGISVDPVRFINTFR